jgi:hypothetical protein
LLLAVVERSGAPGAHPHPLREEAQAGPEPSNLGPLCL